MCYSFTCTNSWFNEIQLNTPTDPPPPHTHTHTNTLLTHKVVVPGALGGDHEEPKEPVRQKHLDLLIVRGQVAVGVVPRVLIISAPLKPQWGQFVGRQGAGPRSKTSEGKEGESVSHIKVLTVND